MQTDKPQEQEEEVGMSAGDFELLDASNLPPELMKALTGTSQQDSRAIGLFGEIGRDTASAVLSALVNYQMEDPSEPITIFINSGGGSVSDALAIWDAIAACSCPITMVGIGEVMSAAAFIMYAGDKGERYLAPNTMVMTHQLSYGAVGNYREMAASHKLATMYRGRLMDLMISKAALKGTKASKRKKLSSAWESDTDTYMWASEAIDKIGIADHIGLPHSITGD